MKDDYLSTESEEETPPQSDGEDEPIETHNNPYENYKTPDSRKIESEKYSNENSRESLNDSRKIKRDIELSNRKHENYQNKSINDKSQPKTSTNTLLNNENVKSNRLNTLMNSVSSTPPLTNRSVRDIVSSMSKLSPPYDRTTELINVNSDEAATQNLLRQINNHKNKKGAAHHRSLQDNLNSIHNGKVTYKDIDEDISSNNLGILTIAVLKLLNQLEIKFPGKNNDSTRTMLQKVRNVVTD